MKRFSLSLALTLALGSLAAPQTFSPDSVKGHVTYLASDKLAGRGSGTRGNEAAAKYIAEQFKKAGLKPAGTKGYLQPFSFPAGVAQGSKNRLQVSGFGRYAAGQTFEPSPLSTTTAGEVSGELVFVGEGLEYSQDVKGKLVVASAEGTGGVRKKAIVAREKGAAGLIVASAEDAALRFEEGDGTDAGLPIATVRKSVVEAWKAKNTPLTGTLQTEVKKQSKTSANILGLLEGSDPALKSEILVIGAHMDHLGLGGTHSLAESKAPAIHHGADDNASGTAGVLELAAYFAKNRPKRSILFMCFSGEELGLLGSAHYVKSPTLPLAQTVAMVNMDMIGRLDQDRLIAVGSGTSPDWNPLLDKLNTEAKFSLSRSESGFGSSDQQSFYNAKIPVLFFFTGLHGDYHRPSDTADKINYDGEAKVLALVARATREIADAPARPGFTQITVVQEQPARFKVSLGSIPAYGYEGEGVQLDGVRPGSPAEKAGMQKGDIIVKFGARTIKNVQEYTLALGDYKPGDVVEIVIKRGDQTLTVKATLAASSR
ncbi:M28 family peptidase [Armatimonas sp.]|uniref:M28 family peptidase n=1 Tax=Armatimonas sp. TaxID=1872638 RepID=UPI00286B9E21|nr:M28 family peptidase [Armatimonas sp.]